ncbi:XRE family transcriptional regulator [Lachnospiraceae bacterium 29-91]
MNTLGARIKNARENIGMSQSELATAIGIKPSSGVISNWERDLNKPDAEKIVKLCDILDISASFLLDYYGKSTFEVRPSEQNIIEKYRSLDNYGQETVSYILDREIRRVQQIRETTEYNAEPAAHIYPYLGKIACAGTGFYFDDIPTDTIEVPYVEGADFIIGVSGESMKPDYHDGEKLYVRKVEYLRNGDIGIFTIGNECFLKELGEDGLISRNKDYDDIPGDEKVRLIGKVIGKVEKD